MLDAPAFVCFDLPCLVIPRPGAAEEALDRALRRLGLEPGARSYDQAMRAGVRWPGREARAALGSVLGNDVWADAAAAAFDDAYGAAVGRSGAVVADGAAACVAQLRGAGARVCITTEFSAPTREAIVDVLDWTGLVAMLLSDDNSSRPEPVSAVTTAIERAGVALDRVVVVAGTRTGVQAGRDAAVPCVVGVPSDTAPWAELRGAGATDVWALSQLAARWSSARLLSA